MMVPEDDGQVRHIRINSTHLRVLLCCLCLFALGNAFLAVQYLSEARETLALTQLREENAYLWAQVAVLDSSVTEFQSQMADLVEMEKDLRILADLPEIAPDVRKVGVGGRSYANLEGLRLAPGQRAGLPRLTLADVDRLLRQAKLEKQSLEEIESAFQDNMERLEHTPTIWPAMGYISRGFGSCTDPFTGLRRPHEGLDIVNRVGTPVVATAAGRISERGWKNGYGWMVVVNHGYGFETAYGHLDSVKVSRGEKVKRGQVIATLGNSGRSTGPHLHYEVRVNGRPVNPHKYLLPDIVVD
jgi:murein DD-endopeptidase MepM/ murein hydrolase activator NlpD